MIIDENEIFQNKLLTTRGDFSHGLQLPGYKFKNQHLYVLSSIKYNLEMLKITQTQLIELIINHAFPSVSC